MSSQAIARIADQVKVDVLSKDHTFDNDAKLKEISRTFICKTTNILKPSI
jgi:threonine aldolase